MRPVRFVALSEDGQAWCSPTRSAACWRCPSTSGSPPLCTPSRARSPTTLTVAACPATIRRRRCPRATSRPASAPASPPRTSPASPACRSTGCCATPARCCRSGRCSPSTPAAPGCAAPRRAPPLAEVVDGRLAQHGIDTEKISWDAYRRDDGTWRIVATWPSGKATAQAIWELDKTRQVGLAARRHGAVPVRRAARPRSSGQEPRRPSAAATGCPARRGPSPARRPRPARRRRDKPRPSRDPIRAGRDALLASLDRPLGSGRGRGLDRRRAGRRRAARPRCVRRRRGAARRRRRARPSTTTPTRPRRCRPCRRWPCCGPRRTAGRRATGDAADAASKPRKRLPSWDDVLFGGGPAARESS